MLLLKFLEKDSDHKKRSIKKIWCVEKKEEEEGKNEEKKFPHRIMGICMFSNSEIS